MIIPELVDQVASQTTTTVEKISFMNGSCIHTNNIKIIRFQNNQHQHSPNIKNSIEPVDSNSFKHLTQIQVFNRKYLIEDLYQFTFNESQTSNNSNSRAFISQSNDSKNSSQSNQNCDQKSNKHKKIKKLCIFQKTGKQGQKFIKRNTKNIPKNFCKAFSGFMAENPKKSGDQWNLAMKHLKKIQRKGTYNNITMKKILQNQSLVPFFKQFLLTEAESWINSSKIADKRVHLQAINIYLQLLDKLAYAEADQSPSDK